MLRTQELLFKGRLHGAFSMCVSMSEKRFVGHKNAIQNAPCNRPLRIASKMCESPGNYQEYSATSVGKQGELFPIVVLVKVCRILDQEFSNIGESRPRKISSPFMFTASMGNSSDILVLFVSFCLAPPAPAGGSRWSPEKDTT
jgi:hypothetical protein